MSDDGKDRSRERERDGSRDRGDEDDAKVTDVMDIDKEDAAFVLGRGGSTKRKIARVSATDIELDEHALTITMYGSRRGCAAAKDYCKARVG